jgi:peptidoglycan hydrolase-like protein with peptidoglycan-binding domain
MSKRETAVKSAVVSAPSVPRAREIREGMHGDDVVAVKRALSRAGYLRWGTFTAVWDAGAIAAVKPFQDDHGVPPGPGTGP